jgi:endonuclease/exonuclease/phosphatase (EEP) superfamily protein YafD
VNWRRALYNRGRVLAVLGLLGLLLPLGLMPFSHSYNRLTWLLDIAANSQWFFALSLAIGLLLTGPTSRRWLWLVPLLTLPWWSAAPALPGTEAATRVFTLVSANVNLHARDPSALLALVERVQPDLLLVVEISPDYAQRLDAALSDYPHRRVEPAHSPFGLALYARHPLLHSRLIEHEGIPAMQAQLQWSGTPVDLIAAHPMPPLAPHFHRQRDEGLLARVGEIDPQRPLLLVGDLNATPWTSLARRLQGRLLRVTGLAPTWPSWLGGVLGVPIDQVLASSHWRRLEARVGPDIGSDHLPVVAKLELLR